ncbi:MAG: glycosyltransferase [Bryobacteraceae bacterium]
MKIAIWTVIPNHYQSAFHGALRRLGADTHVVYFGEVPAERRALGWKSVSRSELLENESFWDPSLDLMENVPAWRERVHVVPGGRTGFLRSLARRLTENGVDWVHWSEPSSPGWKRLAGAPIRYWHALQVNRHALGAFGTGPLAMDDLRRWGMDRFRIASLPYVVAPSEHEYFADTGLDSPPTYLYVGQLCHRKGIDVLLRAFREVLHCIPSARLVVAGTDHSGGLYQGIANALAITQQTTFTGAIPIDGIRALIRSASVLVLPSRFDGWGVVLSEAAAEGLALIATDMCGAAYGLIESGFNGYVVGAGSVQQLAAAMKAYARDPASVLRHGRRSRILSSHFAPDRVAATFLETVTAWRALGRRASMRVPGQLRSAHFAGGE